MRVKTGVTRHRRHKKILSMAKGYRMTRSKQYRVAHQAYMHAGQYSYNDRAGRHSQMRRVWIDRISAAAKLNGTQYSKLMNKLKVAGVELDKKVLADIALNHPESFKMIVETV